MAGVGNGNQVYSSHDPGWKMKPAISILGFGLCLAIWVPGNAWQTIPTGTTSDLFSLQFFGADTGYAVGTSTVLKTVDGGDHWTGQSAGFNIQTSYFLNGSRGWAVSASNAIYRTTNGGQHWDSLFKASFPLRSIAFVDANRGWAIQDPIDTLRILATSNGGMTWSVVFTKPNPLSNLSNPSYAFLSSVKTLFTSLDTGSVLAAYYDYNNTVINNGWIDSGSVLKTVDGGQTWTESPQASSWKAGYRGVGNTWLIMGYPARKQISTPCSPLGCGHCCTYSYGPASLNVIQHISANAPAGNQVTLVANDSQYLQSIHFLGKDTGCAVGTGGLIAWSTNGGGTWINETLKGIDALYDVKILSRSRVFAVGSGGVLLRSDLTIPTSIGDKSTHALEFFTKIQSNLFQYRLPHDALVSITLRDTRGKSLWVHKVMEATGDHYLQLPMNILPPGNYFLNFQASSWVRQFRFHVPL